MLHDAPFYQLIGDLPTGPLADWASSFLGRFTFMLFVHPDVAANSVRELVDFARANPGKLNYSSQGNGTTSHLSAELFKSMAGGLRIAHVPYKGTAPALAALVAGEVDMMCDNLGVSLKSEIPGKCWQITELHVDERERCAECAAVAEAGEHLETIGYRPGFSLYDNEDSQSLLSKLLRGQYSGKNNPADAHEVFDRHSAMRIRRHHLSAECISWEPKSAALRRLETRGVACDFCFLDPPYRLNEAYEATLGFLSQSRMLQPASVVIAEHGQRFDPGERFGALQRYRKLDQGDAGLSFYRLA